MSWAEEAVEVKITIQADFWGFDAEVTGGEVVSLLERGFEFHRNDGKDGVCLGLVDAFGVGGFCDVFLSEKLGNAEG